MAITDEQVFLLNKKFGSVARKVQLGTLIRDAESLAGGLSPVSSVVFSGSFTTVGGDASETISVPGVLATDTVVVSITTAGAVPRTIEDAVAVTDAINVDFNLDPSNDHVLSYQVSRAT